MRDRARAGFALMVVIAVVLGILIGMRNIGVKQDEGLFSVSEILDSGQEPMSPDEPTLGILTESRQGKGAISSTR
jgi:hypothetical protein